MTFRQRQVLRTLWAEPNFVANYLNFAKNLTGNNAVQYPNAGQRVWTPPTETQLLNVSQEVANILYSRETTTEYQTQPCVNCHQLYANWVNNTQVDEWRNMYVEPVDRAPQRANAPEADAGTTGSGQ